MSEPIEKEPQLDLSNLSPESKGALRRFLLKELSEELGEKIFEKEMQSDAQLREALNAYITVQGRIAENKFKAVSDVLRSNPGNADAQALEAILKTESQALWEQLEDKRQDAFQANLDSRRFEKSPAGQKQKFWKNVKRAAFGYGLSGAILASSIASGGVLGAVFGTLAAGTLATTAVQDLRKVMEKPEAPRVKHRFGTA